MTREVVLVSLVSSVEVLAYHRTFIYFTMNPAASINYSRGIDLMTKAYQRIAVIYDRLTASKNDPRKSKRSSPTTVLES
jgi:hypothetical protein